MSFAKPKVQAPTPAPAPIDQGAQALQVGGSADAPVNTQGSIGRLALRVGNPMIPGSGA